MDNSPAVAFLKDETGRLVYASTVFEQKFQLSRDDWHQKSDCDLWPADVAKILRENDLRVLREQKTLELVEQVPSRHTGELQQWLTFKFPVHDLDGARLVGGMAIEITERTKTEQVLRSTQEQLRQSQKMEAVGKLAGGIAHDFNNLLTVILGYSRIILGDLGPHHPLRTDIEEIHHAAQRSSALTRQLLTFSRQQICSPQVLDVNTTVVNVEKLLRRIIGDDVLLETSLNCRQSHVVADVGQMEQVIVNLAVNARDAMPEGGRLTIETADVECDEAFSTAHPDVAPGSYAMLAISDTGHGMSQETQSQIFEPFYTTKDSGEGTGLGLSTVFGIVSQNGGHIFVQSEKGQGTTFKVYFPVASGPAEQSAEKPAAPRQINRKPAGSELILLVDDHRGVRSLAGRVLKKNGYRVLEASSSAEAISCVTSSSDPVDLLLTDVVMLGRSGPELADRLRAVCPNLKVLFMSGYTGDLLLQRDFDRRREPFLQKPFESETLLRQVRAVLDGMPEASHAAAIAEPKSLVGSA